jgi:hypothetical protein
MDVSNAFRNTSMLQIVKLLLIVSITTITSASAGSIYMVVLYLFFSFDPNHCFFSQYTYFLPFHMIFHLVCFSLSLYVKA